MNEKYPEIKTKLDELKWFIELLNLELNEERIESTTCSNSDIELHLLMYRARKIPVSGDRRLEEYELYDQVIRGEVTGKDFISLQKKIRLIIKEIIKKNEDSIVREGTDWIAVENWKYGSGIIYQDLLPNKCTVEISGLDFKGSRNITTGKTFLRWNSNMHEERRVSVSMRSANFAEYLFGRFLEVINQMPCNSFKRCPECKAYFIQISKKEKVYCSNKCASRVGSRNRREILKTENPLAYSEELKRGSQRARESYEKKIQSGIPARNPYKYKDEE